ncbi:MAG: ANTAR domain-containing protein [Pseudomonadota bacterium]
MGNLEFRDLMVTADVKNARLLLVDGQQQRATKIIAELAAHGVSQVFYAQHGNTLLHHVETTDPQLIVIGLPADVDHTSTLHCVSVLNEMRPTPIMMFASGKDPDFVDSALSKGVTMFVTEMLQAERIVNRLGVVMAKFDRTQSLLKHTQDLDSRLQAAEGKLSEEKIIARAKALLIEHDRLTEDQAHRALHQFSMQENFRLVEVAARVIDAHTGLDRPAS